MPSKNFPHKIYGQSIKIDPRCAPNEWYMIKNEADKLLIPKNLEEKAARLFAKGWTDWKGAYGISDVVKREGTKFVSDIPGGKGNDPLREAIDRAVQELK